MIKAVFMDIDGTLLNSNREISEKNKEQIKRCVQKGIKIILTSGRARKQTIEFQELCGASPYIISSNGASVYDKGKDIEIFNNLLSKDIAHKLLKVSNENGYKIQLNYKNYIVLNLAYYSDEEELVKSMKELNEIIEKNEIAQCVISNQNFEKMLEFREYIRYVKGIRVVNESKRFNNFDLEPTKSYYCDITSSGVSKGIAVMKMCKYLNISKEEIITIGDGKNDISMFEQTKNSYAMENSFDFVKANAKNVTNSNDEDGVAKVLELL